jgi:hypothetical protein
VRETTFTKGPWGRGRTSDDQVLVLGRNGEGRYVCTVQIHQTPRRMGQFDEPERLANAALIIAAPDLFDFVRDCADGRPELDPGECRRRAIALLAKVSP